MSIKKLSFRKEEAVAVEKLDLPEEVLTNLRNKKAQEARTNVKSKITQVISVVVAIVGWYVMSETVVPNLPNPVETAIGSFWAIQDSWYYNSILYSVARVYTGFGLGCAIGIPMGLIMGWNRIANDFGFPTFELIRPIPPVAWVPLSIILTGAITPAIIFITFLGTWYVVTLNSVLGAERLDESYLRAGKCLGAKPRQIFRHVVLPGALPSIFTGMVIGMAMSWITVVAGEMIAGDYGVGYLAWQSYSLIRYPEVILAMLTIGSLGYISSMFIRALSNKYLAWRKVYG